MENIYILITAVSFSFITVLIYWSSKIAPKTKNKMPLKIKWVPVEGKKHIKIGISID